jgi:hypothetical protein
MRTTIVLLAAAAGLAACGKTTENGAASNGAANAAAAEKPRPAYCFFKDSETKDWKGAVDASGNVVVTGKAYRQDSRYKAVLSPATVSGATAEIAPTITANDTGFAAPDDWWPLSATIPNSQAVDTVTVRCGDKTLAIIKMFRRK